LLTVPEDEKPKPPQTNFLNVPSDAQPMPDREPAPGTNLLSSAWRLVFKIGNETVNLQVGEPITVGRIVDTVKDADIGFDLSAYGAYQGGVSRRHAVITYSNGALYIEDLGSTNGTRINGFQLTAKRKYRLRDGDEIEFARLRTSARFIRPSS
jgi:pSer/pThr/pTyr-binding forkhead associated (FHA) protein